MVEQQQMPAVRGLRHHPVAPGLRDLAVDVVLGLVAPCDAAGRREHVAAEDGLELAGPQANHLVAPGVPAGHRELGPAQLCVAVDPDQLALAVQRLQHQVAGSDRFPGVARRRRLAPLDDVVGVGERGPPVRADRRDGAAGVVEVQVREQHAVDGLGRYAARRQPVEQELGAAALRPRPEPGVDQHCRLRRLDQERGDGDEQRPRPGVLPLGVGHEQLVGADREAALGQRLDVEVAVGHRSREAEDEP